MKFCASIVFVALLALVSSQNDPNYCFSTDTIKPQLAMFSTKTSYEVARGRSVHPAVSNCKPSKFWMLQRHGTRLPNENQIVKFPNIVPRREEIVRNYNAGLTALCAADFQLINNWTFDSNITIERESLLTVAGWNVMQDLAQRYQTAFPTLLPFAYNRQQFLFRHTERQRSQGSIRAFADGLFGFNGFQGVTFETVPTIDTFLLPHENCPAYIATRNNTAVEQLAFEEGTEFQEMLSQVNTKLGFFGSSQMSSQDVRTMWEFCRFDQTSNLEESSAWCTAFSIANHAVLEYYYDIGDFYATGYGGVPRRLFENLNCNLMQDMLRFMESTDSGDQVAKIFGTHSSALQLFLVSLGVFDDASSLNRHNYAQQTFRQWRTSLLTPKGANLAVIRYDCADGENEVAFYFNEKTLVIPGCQTNGLCKVSMILERYSRFLNANCANLFCSTN
ncbi:unnamed protein product [Diamesa hyperborea]